MSLPGSFTLTLETPVRRAERAIATIAPAAAALVPWLIVPRSLGALVYGLCCAAVVGFAAHRAGWLGTAHRLACATWHADGRWTLSDPRKPPQEALLLGDSRVAANWVWLRWRTEEASWHRRSMLITSSDLPPDQWRHLAVRLRLQGRTCTPVAFSPAL
jgi:Membrane-bound toxin component of toxin-antitoxin system